MKTISSICLLLCLSVVSCQTDSSVVKTYSLVEEYKGKMSQDPLVFNLINHHIDFSIKVSYIYKATPKAQWELMVAELEKQEAPDDILLFLKNKNIHTNNDFRESLATLNATQADLINKYNGLLKLSEKDRNEIWRHCLTIFDNRIRSAKGTDCCSGMRGHLWGCVGGSTVILGFSWLTGLGIPALRGASWANDCIRKAEQTYGGCCQ